LSIHDRNIEGTRYIYMNASRQPTKLFNKNFVLLWQGQFVSQIGNQAYAIAMMFWIKHATGSASLMGLLMMLSMLPAVILGPLGGTLADRYSRRKIIIFTDFANGLAVLSLAALYFIMPESTNLIILWLFFVSIFVGLMGAFFRPAISAAIPDLVPTDKVAAANSLNQSSFQISTFIGQGSGGILFRLLGAPVLFLIDSITYLISALSESFIEIPQTTKPAEKDRSALLKSFLNDTADGFKFIWKNRGMRDLFVVAAFLNLFFAPYIVLLPFYVEDHLNSTTDWYGFLVAAIGLGSLIGYLIAGAIKIPGRIRGSVVVILLLAFALLFGGLGLTRSTYIAFIMMFFGGLCNGMINIQLITVLQLTTPGEIRGRVFGVLGTLSAGLMPIGLGLAGVVADLVDQKIVVIFAVCGLIIAALSIILMASRGFHDYVSYEYDNNTGNSAV
jgi:DHA3 family macrolide efflux protein-like MFS transporter